MKKILLTILLFSLKTLNMFSQTMYLDSTFNGIGFASYYYNARYDGAYDLAIQNDGKIVLVGDATYFTATLIWKVERLNADGTNDTTFQAQSNFPNAAYSTAWAVEIQSDQKILVAGSTANGNIIARYETTGKIDSTFGSFGFASIDPLAVNIFALTNGKIIICGQGSTGIARLNSDGSIDSTFGVNGTVVVDSLLINSATIQQNENLILSGYLPGDKAELVRLDTAGNVDAAFGNNGRVFPLGSTINNQTNFSIIQSDGKIICSSFDLNSPYQNIIQRLDSNGIMDSTFYFASPMQNTRFYDGVILPNGKSLFAAFTTYLGIRFIQLNLDGSPDSTFLSNDSIIASLSFDRIYHMALQNDGKILTVGRFSYTASDQFSVFRFTRDFTSSILNPLANATNYFFVWHHGNDLVIKFSRLFNTDISKIKIYDLEGRKLIEFAGNQLNRTEERLLLPLKDEMIKGIYIITIETDDFKLFSSKILIE